MYDLLVNGRLALQCSTTGGDIVTIDMSTGTASKQTGAVSTIKFAGLPDYDRSIEIWLPHNETTELVALRATAPIEPTASPIGDTGRKVWLHHGSSISHGSNAESPTAIWPALAALRGGWN